MFLRDKLGIAQLSADDIFTCYWHMRNRTKMPAAFVQALRDTKRAGYIEYNSPDDMQISIMGENYFAHDLKKKEAKT
jgi:hypothetical protein